VGVTSLEAKAQFLKEGGPTVGVTLAQSARNAGGQGEDEAGRGRARAAKGLHREQQETNSRACTAVVILYTIARFRRPSGVGGHGRCKYGQVPFRAEVEKVIHPNRRKE
jgi:hypothetical protein